ncbi:twin-arginine translocation signal domain-containing protein, partial [Magnetovibrio blakemorei]|uniref:twin-arginine translocation signal domain-containing protein n=1 Tax=Magnetovibrio blakemorei TaxID=28181 RepID=UPI000B2601AE
MTKSIETNQDKALSRRKFLKGTGVAATGAAASVLAAPHLAKAATVIKMQAAWGGGIFLEFAQDYVDRVNKMAGGSMKIELLGVDAVVKTAEMQTAVHKGVLDAAHFVAAYWYSKSPVASLFGTGPCFGWSANEL